MTTPDERVPVLIVGGALAGLSTAVFLASHGVKALVVERHPDTLLHPRARGINPRTVEAFRQVGLEAALRAEASMNADFGSLPMLRAESLAGREIFSGPADQPDPSGDVSPTTWVPIDQDRLEHVLRAKAVESGVELRFSTEAVSHHQDVDGVSVVLLDRESGQRRTVRADYLIAADGGRSPLREALGIGVQGPGMFATTLSVLFEADLEPVLRGRRFGMSYLDQPHPQTVIYPHDGERRWIFATSIPQGRTLEEMTDDEFQALIAAAIGRDDIDVTILAQLPAGGVKALRFDLGAQVAQQYRSGRIFLVGDSAHLVPPTGGFGASLGIQDAHNLAWKLAAVLTGTAGPALLETYERERQAAAFLTFRTSLSLMHDRTGSDADKDHSADYGATVFGYRYDGGAPVPPGDLCGQPGTRAPHVVLTDGAAESSSLDLFGGSFVLLTSGSGEWAEAGAKAAARTDVALAVHVVDGAGSDLRSVAGGFAAAYGIEGGGAVLVRPDGFVAWRAETPSGTAEDDVVAALLAATARAEAG
ncbi:2-polyprenyl-6-methoxyphenol hydroxylase-like FAD-dependent oxidoreductase [Actinoalloteichus hoggarensis]|uniref:2,4-dichlorophenol 6-monooxygenase n=1 Tax=Actinoalloteichus hoggarensis TaxID=1470176 RepID=A0A221W1R1_9PSEU|nr:FAD-dependent monooxygenase [Actinoalloteichus hoggarensis]ASO19697.1 2,4-dichlorophenol 6-monooxygenase [Actinoalloteichus hoggarensis]MBB5919596.1 2-polyprenyl-6-methoxyphenol hydroxylase-like FAD-dependent oxidoreductase [Actinoalloteichus hoggarensis]